MEMRITISLDEKLVAKARKIAAKRNLSLTKLVREHLEQLVAARELEALQRSFEMSNFKMGPRAWNRADLHERH